MGFNVEPIVPVACANPFPIPEAQEGKSSTIYIKNIIK
jgi:hypothetical protein